MCVCVCVCVCHSEYLVPAHALLYCVCTVHSVCRFHKPVLALCWTLVERDGDRGWPCNRTIPHSHDPFAVAGCTVSSPVLAKLPSTNICTICCKTRGYFALHFVLPFCLYALSQSRQFIQFHRSIVLSNIACKQVCLLPKWILRGVAINNEINKRYKTIHSQTQLMCVYIRGLII